MKNNNLISNQDSMNTTELVNYDNPDVSVSLTNKTVYTHTRVIEKVKGDNENTIQADNNLSDKSRLIYLKLIKGDIESSLVEKNVKIRRCFSLKKCFPINKVNNKLFDSYNVPCSNESPILSEKKYKRANLSIDDDLKSESTFDPEYIRKKNLFFKDKNKYTYNVKQTLEIQPTIVQNSNNFKTINVSSKIILTDKSPISQLSNYENSKKNVFSEILSDINNMKRKKTKSNNSNLDKFHLYSYDINHLNCKTGWINVHENAYNNADSIRKFNKIINMLQSKTKCINCVLSENFNKKT